MTSPSSDQLAEIEYISGVTAVGTVSSRSFATWNDDTPATYGSTSGEAKWGAPVAGTGATVTVAFATASNWTATEKQAFTAAMDLWSAVANVHFTVVGTTGSAGLVINRTSNGTAEEGTDRYYPGVENTARLGTLGKTEIDIDTSVSGFGPLGQSFSTAGGYPWMTIEHEIGHAIGLGHAGPYDDSGSDTANYPTLGAYDNRGWSIMSYHSAAGYVYPTTPMILDIAAVQRVYGVATDSPLAGGGQVFGFNSNIGGDIASFFNFSINTRPYVTIWDGGSNNTLDLSGFATGSTVSLVDGSLNSVAGLSGNLGIAFGTRIETVIGGSGADRLTGNMLDDVIQGGAGSDTLAGGSGNDHIYGNLRGGTQGLSDGDDVITTGGGNDYVNGNAGNDRITADTGDNRLYGGAGNDSITAGSGNNHINGNAGDDVIVTGSGNNVVYGGQGNDTIRLGSGNNVVSGDAGSDHIIFGSGYVLATGGAGNDVFAVGGIGQSGIGRGGALAGYVNEITDFQPGSDLLYFPRTIGDVLHDPNGAAQGSVADARADAQALLDAHGGMSEIAAIQVGSDTYLFWNDAGTSDAINAGLKLDGVSAAAFTTASLSSNAALVG